MAQVASVFGVAAWQESRGADIGAGEFAAARARNEGKNHEGQEFVRSENSYFAWPGG